MAEKSTFIKIDRNIINWGWYHNVNTKVVFIHLILKANIKEHKFENIVVNRGELVTSYPSLAKDLGLSIQNVRTAIKHLESTEEITVRKYPKFSLISIKNYDKYQTSNSQSTVNQQSANSQLTANQQQSKNEKNDKNERMKETLSGEFSPEPPVGESDSENQKSKSKKRKTKQDYIPDWFEEVWKMYPRKEGKSAISKDSFKAISEAGKETIVRAIENYKKKIAENHTEKRYICMGSTFFNGRWHDYTYSEQEQQAEMQQAIQDSYQDDFFSKLLD